MCAALNVLFDQLGAVITKKYASELRTWEINLVRFGSAAAAGKERTAGMGQRTTSRIPRSAIEDGVQPLREIRDKVGMDLDILVDGHAHFQLPAALRIAEALREVQPLWLEDVIKMDNQQNKSK